MHINQLQIKNFRGFEDKTINLNPQFTCAIGDNGTGKSSLLYSIQVALGGYIQCLELPGVKNRQIRDEERFVKWNEDLKEYQANKEIPFITAFAEFDNLGIVSWTRRKKHSSERTKDDDHDLFNLVHGLLIDRNNQTKPPVLLPVIASFGTGRLNSQLRKGRNAQSRRSRVEKGYLASLEDKVDFNGVIEWLHNYDSELKYEKEFSGTREAVFEAITTAIPYLEDINYNSFYGELEAVVNIDEYHHGRKTHSNMSDGLMAMLNLVAELAFRCVMLNGKFGTDAVKKSSGVVMIDELDMHLHPNWQRHVVKDLKTAFPNIQFVVTTHSPFIVQSLSADELIILDEEQINVNPNDLTINKVATDIMGVSNLNGDDFLKRHDTALKSFETLIAQQHKPTLDDYLRIKNAIAGIVDVNTTDPVYKAYLESTKK